MALKIRLRQQGRKNHLTYRLVVTDSRSPRDGGYVEKVGHYDPSLEKDVTMDGDRVQYWLDRGAKLSEKVESLVARAAPGVIVALRERQRRKKMGKKEKK